MMRVMRGLLTGGNKGKVVFELPEVVTRQFQSRQCCSLVAAAKINVSSHLNFLHDSIQQVWLFILQVLDFLRHFLEISI